jgi:zinc transport system substrate-binding protein
MRGLGLVSLFIAFAMTGAAAAQEAPPQVLVSIRPLHSIVAGVMGETAKPGLLIEGAASPHAYALTPGAARKIGAAEIVFWGGPGLETFLAGSLDTLASDAAVHDLSETPGLHLLPPREGGVWEAHGHDEPHAHAVHAEEDGHDHGPFDPHFWLDPANGIAMARHLARILGETDPANAAAYAANAEAFAARVAALDGEISGLLAPVTDTPYIVFHDAYQYFEAHYGLSPQGSVTIAADRPSGTRRIVEIRQRVSEADVACIFAPPQFPPRLVSVLIEHSEARTAVLDDLGTDIEAGPQLYETMLGTLAAQYRECLAP